MRFILISILLTIAFIGISIKGKSQEHNQHAKGILIYPNPTNESSEFINVKVASLKSDNVKLALHNIIGNEVPVETEIVDEHHLKIRISDLAAGYYLITVKNEESNFRAIYKILIR